MCMTDPIADMLTRIRNAYRIDRREVKIPASKVKVGIAQVLKREGFIDDYSLVEAHPQGELVVNLRYGPDRERVINKIERVSKPGRRIYSQVTALRPVLNGLGISIVSTSKGILSDRECRQNQVGGEVLARVW